MSQIGHLPQATYLDSLREAGYKITSARKELLSAALLFHRPFTVEDILVRLSHGPLPVHRATVYRDVIHFVRAGVFRELAFLGVPAHHYEVAGDRHHHHFVCQQCQAIVDVNSDDCEGAITLFEGKIAKKGLHVTHHSLKFYGTCTKCSDTKEGI